jgi:hypothetical protein
LLDLDRLFPMEDAPSARLMKLKAFCLLRAGVLTAEEEAAIRQKAEAILQNPPLREVEPQRRAA